MQSVPINKIRNNPINPRLVNKAKFEKLKKSIQEFPQMLELRPIVINEDGVILGGNMRYKALVELGYEEVPVIVAEHITKEQENEFIIKDNLGFGKRSWRYAMVVDNGVIEKIFIEPGKSDDCLTDPYGETSPERVLEYLTTD